MTESVPKLKNSYWYDNALIYNVWHNKISISMFHNKSRNLSFHIKNSLKIWVINIYLHQFCPISVQFLDYRNRLHLNHGTPLPTFNGEGGHVLNQGRAGFRSPKWWHESKWPSVTTMGLALLTRELALCNHGEVSEPGRMRRVVHTQEQPLCQRDDVWTAQNTHLNNELPLHGGTSEPDFTTFKPLRTHKHDLQFLTTTSVSFSF